MERSIMDKALVVTTVVLGGLSVLLGVSLIGGLISGGWAIGDWPSGVVTPPAIPLGIIGPFAALAGAHMLRRAEAENRPDITGRVLLVGGTLGIAALAGAVYWTIVGPIIAATIVLYWSLRLGGWRGQRRPTV